MKKRNCILINAMNQLSKEFVQIERLIIGGENDDWAVEKQDSSAFYSG